MKKLVLCVLLATASSASYAEDISYEKECPDGGSRQVSGSYDSTSGDFKLVTEIKECARYGEVSNGTHIAEGTFLVANSIFEPTADIEAVISSDLTMTHEEEIVSFNCTKTIKGSYDMTTNTLDGEIKSDCTHNGKVTIPILDLLSGNDEEMDNHEEPNGENNNENSNGNNNEYPDINDIKDQIDQCVNPDWNPDGNSNENDEPWDEENQNGNSGNNQGGNQGNHNGHPNGNGPYNQGQNPWDEEEDNNNNEWDENEWDENDNENENGEEDDSEPNNVVLPVSNPIY